MNFKEKDGKVVFNISDGHDNYSQRNNEFQFVRGDVKYNALDMCNVTSMCMALDYAGYIFPKGPYKQPEDNLAQFLFTDPEVDDFYKRSSTLYDDYRAGKKGAYTPPEVHSVLSFGTNKWMGKYVTTFSESLPIDSIFEEIIQKNKAVIISGKFGNLHHIVCLVGLIYAKKDTIQNSITLMPESVIYDDPYGVYDKTTGKYLVKSGNDCIMPFKDFLDTIKPLGDARKKWGHIIL